jgi:hypothetical protein
MTDGHQTDVVVPSFNQFVLLNILNQVTDHLECLNSDISTCNAFPVVQFQKRVDMDVSDI